MKKAKQWKRKNNEKGKTMEKEKTMRVSLNGQKVNEINVPTLISDITIRNLILNPGDNVVALDTDNYLTITPPEGSGVAYYKFSSTTLAFEIRSISITD